MSKFHPDNDGGWFNLDRVQHMQPGTGGNGEVVVDGLTIKANVGHILDSIASITAAPFGWECVSYWPEKDGSIEIRAVPILAWALTVSGRMEPIAPEGRPLVEYVLRHVSGAKVFDGAMTYDSAEEWARFRIKNGSHLSRLFDSESQGKQGDA